MLRIRDQSIARKILLLLVGSTLVALGFVAVALTAYYKHVAYVNASDRLETITTIVGQNCRASVLFDDEALAAQLLESLRTWPEIRYAALLTPDSRLLSTFGAKDRYGPSGVPAGETTERRANELWCARDIIIDGKKIGRILLVQDTSEIEKNVWAFRLVILGVSVVAIFVAIVLSQRFQRAVVEPIHKLAATASKISTSGDYTLRAERTTNDEIGTLIDAFNTLIVGTQDRDLRLAEQKNALQAIMDNAPSVIYVKSLDGRYLLRNRKFDELFLTGNRETFTDTEVFSPETALAFRKNDQSVAEQKLPVEFEEHTGTKNGMRTYLSVKFPLVDSGGIVRSICGISTDITERKRVDEEKTRLRALLQNMIDSMPSILVTVDSAMCVMLWNREAERVTAVTQENAKGQPLDTLIPWLKSRLELIESAIRDRALRKEPKAYCSLGNDRRVLDITVFPLVTNGVDGAVIRVDDVTDRVRLEEMMIQSEKMMSVGGLAAGMAHEINNPLAGMLQNAQVMANRLKPDLKANVAAAEKCGVTIQQIGQYMELRAIPAMLAAIRESGERAAAIVQNMLSFSRRSSGRKTRENIHALLDSTLQLAENDYDLKKKNDFRKIRIVRNYADALPEIDCSPTEIQQVLFNLLKNSAQALSEKCPEPIPEIAIRTLREENSILIEISDNGPGIPEDVKRHIFEPFFTTKPVGVGTGLGLSVSYFIITENHNGSMEVRSKNGPGTIFCIRLPIQDLNSNE